jgi:hypothetical protein
METIRQTGLLVTPTFPAPTEVVSWTMCGAPATGWLKTANWRLRTQWTVIDLCLLHQRTHDVKARDHAVHRPHSISVGPELLQP